jgi:undecaprenyl-diphosphatase
MSDVIKAAILGVIEGLTEFLPVSSTGHMIVAMPLLEIDPDRPPWHAFLYFIQIGAILAVVVYFAGPLLRELRHRPPGGWPQHLLVKLAVASLPAAAIGLPLNDWVERRLEHPAPVAAALVAGAAVMELIERRFRRPAVTEAESVTLRQALFVGLAQCVSIIPGTSRAMATIMGGLIVGLSPAAATQFSFYLAIPTLLGAGTLKVVKHRHELNADEAALLAVGFGAAFFVALLVVRSFLQYVQRHRFRPFAIYRVLLGAAVLAWWWTSSASAAQP